MLRRTMVFLVIFFVATLAAATWAATAESPTSTTFTGTVYYKNYHAGGATVSLSYAMHTYSVNADENGFYNLTVDYVGSGKAVLTASYNGDMDAFTWYPEAGAHIMHDFWIVPRPTQNTAEGPTASFEGHVYYNGTAAKDAHVILVYGKYILDEYANDTGYYGMTIYYQGMPGRIWATHLDGRSEDYWPNPGQGGTVVTDINIAPKTGYPTATPAPTSGPTVTPTQGPAGSPTPPSTSATPTPSPGIVLTVLAVAGGCGLLYLYRLKK